MKKSINFRTPLRVFSKFTALFAAIAFLSVTLKAQYNVTWTNATNVTVTGNTIKKTGGGFAYDAGATSANKLPACADGYAECTINDVSSGKIFGFAPNCGWGVSDITQGFLIGTNQFWLLINGVMSPAFPNPGWSCSNGDIFKVERVGNNIKHYHNGSLILTSSISPAPTTDWCFSGTIVDPSTGQSDISNAKASFAVPGVCNLELWRRDNSTSSLYNHLLNDKVGIGITTPSEKLDINGKLRVRTIDQATTETRYLMADANGVVKYKENISAFDGWYKQGSTLLPTSITDDIYTNGKVKIGQQLEVNNTLSIWGGTLTGGTYDRFALYADNSNGLLFEAPRATNSNFGTKLPIGFGWRGGPVAMTITGSSTVGIGVTNTLGYKLYVNGDAYTTGSWVSSDRNLKNNVQRIEKPMDLISRLNGYTYYFNDMNGAGMNLPKEKQMGLIAQELAEVVPEAVQKDDNGYYAVNYDMVIPLLIEGVKENNNEVEQLKKEVEELKALLKNSGGAAPLQPSQGVTPGNQMNIRPNPTVGITSVDYTITGNFSHAKIVVVNALGLQVGEFAVKTASGTVEVDATTMAGGTYFCNLIVDGTTQEVKKFVVAK